jgi:hypothetical protein
MLLTRLISTRCTRLRVDILNVVITAEVLMLCYGFAIHFSRRPERLLAFGKRPRTSRVPMSVDARTTVIFLIWVLKHSNPFMARHL